MEKANIVKIDTTEAEEKLNRLVKQTEIIKKNMEEISLTIQAMAFHLRVESERG